MYNTILVPINLFHAEIGKKMLEIARRFGKSDTKFVLVNVVESIPNYIAAELPSGLIEKTKASAQKELQAIAQAAGLHASVEVRTGRPHNAILDVAAEKDADLIIVASHMPGIQDYLLGSTAARVVRHAKCSVLVIR